MTTTPQADSVRTTARPETPQAPPMIELRNVTKFYGTVIGVNDFSLRIPAGVYGILGPNGSGKTTLINLITGQLRPSLGEVRIFGDNPWNNRHLYERLGLCPSEEVRYHNVSALEWIQLLMQVHGFAAAEALHRTEAALARVGLPLQAAERPMGTYSKGMRQRAKLAQAIAHEPDLLVLDEPFNGLDPVGRHDLTEFFREWGRDHSLILASHILHEVEAIASRFLLILESRLLAVGSADELHEKLNEVPKRYTIRTDRADALAQWLLEHRLVESLRFRGTDAVEVSARNAFQLAERLPEAMQATGARIEEFRSPDESLQSLFHTLLRIHRGET